MERTPLKKRITGGGNYFTSAKKQIEFIKSGCLNLDLALGGGWVEGRIANIIGDKSTGKTLLCIEAAANFAAKYPKGVIRYAECESAFDPNYAKALGFPIDQVDFGDEPLETVEDFYNDLLKYTKSGKRFLYILDSLDALSDTAEIGRDFSEKTYGAGKAKDMAKLFRMMVRALERSHGTLIIVSQIRDNIGASFMQAKTKRSGGRAMDFYATHAVDLINCGKISKTIKGAKRVTGIKVRAKIAKNKVALPFREAQFNILFGFGVDDERACVEFLKETKGLPDHIKASTTEDYLRGLRTMDASAYQDEMLNLHGMVTNRWYAIEDQFIPKRSKYG